MRVFTAPEHVVEDYPIVFLAGGITNCSEWQKKVIEYFKDKDYDYIICNPRRNSFPIHNPNASYSQIKWEFDCLERCGIFTMYFDKSDKSDQPICFYELGRNICRLQERYPDTWYNRMIITCHKDFKRIIDVQTQVGLATNGKVSVYTGDVFTHIEEVERLFLYKMV